MARNPRVPNGAAKDETKIVGFSFISMMNEADRGCALVLAEALSDFLKESIANAMSAKGAGSADIKEMLLNLNAPLSTFAARIKAAYWFGLIGPKTYDMLEGVRRIRNRFAHTAGPIDFTDTKVRTIVRSLAKYIVDESVPVSWFVEHSMVYLFGAGNTFGYVKRSDERELFMKIGVILCHIMIARESDGSDCGSMPQW